MTASKPKLKAISLILIAAHFFSLSIYSADEPSSASATPSLPTPSITPQDQAGGDRSKSAAMAQGLAMAGAAMAGLGCIMGMNEARKMPPGKEKSMAMMQAMQQCSQAAQSAANAAKNDDAKKGAQSSPGTPQLTPPKAFTADKGESEKFQMPQIAEEASDEIASTEEIPEPSLSPPTLEEPKIDGGFADLDPGFTGKAVSISALNPIEASNVGFNENNKNETPTITPPVNGVTGGLLGFGKAFTPEEVKNLVTAQSVPGVGKDSPRGGKGEEAEASGNGDLSGSSDSGNGAFDQLLSQLMGGAPPGDTLGGGFGGGDLIALPKDQATGRGPNIFEYASYRYQVATYSDGRVRTGPKKEAARTIASEVPATALALKNLRN